MATEREQNARSSLTSAPRIISQDTVARSYFKVILLQVLLTICFALPLIFVMGKIAALSALLGGAIAVLGSLVYARLALVITDSAGAIFRAHVRAEVSKVMATVAMFSVVLVFMQWVGLPWLFAAFLIASAGYWVSLLVIK